MKENDKLHDALERQSELIAALRNEIATKDKRIKELEGRNKQQELSILSLAESHKKQEQCIAELEQTILYLTVQCQECVEQLSEGHTYSEGCKP